jgi:hypothetical protein
MVPRTSFPPGAERGALPSLKLAAEGFVDTGYPCRAEGEAVVISGRLRLSPPSAATAPCCVTCSKSPARSVKRRLSRCLMHLPADV